MLKGGYFILIFFAGFLRLGAQEISHQVLVPYASTWSGDNIYISQTVGEPAVVMFHGDIWDLTQGFQQPSISQNPVVPPQGNGVKVFPNPVSERLYVEMFGDVSVDYEITIFGIEGTLYFKKEYKCTGSFWRVELLDFSEFKRGLYFVRVQTTPRKIERLFKIEKM